jgi:hypothetical protein
MALFSATPLPLLIGSVTEGGHRAHQHVRHCQQVKDTCIEALRQHGRGSSVGLSHSALSKCHPISHPKSGENDNYRDDDFEAVHHFHLNPQSGNSCSEFSGLTLTVLFVIR